MKPLQKITHALALAVRVLTVPPVMVALLVAGLLAADAGVYETPAQAAVSVVCLSAVPALAYPLSAAIPRVRKKGREGQRNLAFRMTAVGYLAALLYGAVCDIPVTLRFFHLTYFLSLVILLIFNRALHIRASGHACSVTGPAGFAVLYLPPWAGALGVMLYAFVAWASVKARRHTPGEFFFGTLSCFLAAFFAALISGVL